MTDYVVMPEADYKDILDATRKRTGKSASLVSSEVGAEIRSIGANLPTISNPATAADVLAGRSSINSEGKAFTGTMPNNGAISKSIDGITEKSFTIPKGFTSGGTVSLTDDIDNEVDTQAELISQVKAVLESKQGASGEEGGGDGASYPLTIYAISDTGYSEGMCIGVKINEGTVEYYTVSCDGVAVEVCTIPSVSSSDTVTVYFTNECTDGYNYPSIDGNGCTITADTEYTNEDGMTNPIENCTVTITNVTEDASVTLTIPTYH